MKVTATNESGRPRLFQRSVEDVGPKVVTVEHGASTSVEFADDDDGRKAAEAFADLLRRYDWKVDVEVAKQKGAAK